MGSPVLKARFYVGEKWWKVMLNPSDISFNAYSYEHKKATNGKGEANVGASVDQQQGSSTETISMQLHFDLVHKYEALSFASVTGTVTNAANIVNAGLSSVLSMIPGLGSLGEEDTFHIEESLTSPLDPITLSLFDEKTTCFSHLEKAASEGTPVLFHWGEMNYCGTLNNFSARIDYFSKFGGALRAEVNLSLVVNNIIDDLKSKIMEAKSIDVGERAKIAALSVLS